MGASGSMSDDAIETSPRAATADRDDYPAAAAKHLADAELLYEAGHCDGAAYLTGYIAECALKTLVEVAGREPPRSHDLGRLRGRALELAALPGARTARYAPAPGDLDPLLEGGAAWRPGLRYRGWGTVPEGRARRWLAAARGLYQRSVVEMRLDGVIC